MKKLVVIGLLALSLGLPARADLKVARVDTSKVFDAFYKTQEMATRIAARRATFEKQIEQLTNEHSNLDQEAQRLNDEEKNPATSPELRKSDDAALAQKVVDLQLVEKEIDQVRKTDSQEIHDELLRSHQEISDELLKAIAAYGAAQGYDLILDETSDPTAPSPLYFYGSPNVDDLTTQIIAKLNAKAPASAPTH
jgi:Skp family chaperone for outer membrane proteins